MLMSRKLRKVKWCISDFGHISTRIAKTNLAFPLVRDMCSMLGSSPKACQCFAWVVNSLGLFYCELQILLKPLYYQKRKWRVFHLGIDWQGAFWWN